MANLVDLAYTVSLEADAGAFSNLVNTTQNIKNNMNSVSNIAERNTSSFQNVANAVNTVNERLEGTENSARGTERSLTDIARNTVEVTHSADRMNGVYRDTNGRLRDVNGRFVSMRNSSQQVGEEVERTRQRTASLGEQANRTSDTFSRLAKGLVGAFAVKKIFDFGKASAGTFAEFEQSMANVHATMGDISTKDFAMLTETARKYGRDTKYSASQVAEALNYEALAGWNAQQSSQALPTILNLASAGNMELQKSSDLVTDSMSAMGLSFDDLGKFSDQLAKTSQKSNTNIQQLGEGILVAGGSCVKAGMDMTAINTELGILADAGKKGAEGGTALRNVLLNMTGNDKVHTFLHDMGVETADLSTGKIRPLNDILVDLKKKTDKMTQSQKMASLSVIGGKENIQALNILLDGSGKKYDSLSQKIKNSEGCAKAMADTQNNTVQGALLGLKSAIEDVQIELFTTKGNGQGLQKAIIWITYQIPKAKKILKTFASGVGKAFKFIAKHKDIVIPAITGIVGAFAMFKTVDVAKKSIKGLGGALKFFTSPAGLMVGAIALIIGSLVYAYNHSEKFRKQVKKLTITLKNIAGFVMEYVVPVITGAFGSLFNTAKAIFNNIGQAVGGLITIFNGVVDFIAGVFTGNWARALGGLKNIFTGIIENIKGTFKGMLNFITSGINVLLGGISKIHFKVPKWVPKIGGKEFKVPDMQIPRLAQGTQNWQGGLARTDDEYGGEIKEYPSGTKVFPHDESIRIARQEGRKEAQKPIQNINLSVNINGAKDSKEIAREVRKELENIFGTLNLQLGFENI